MTKRIVLGGKNVSEDDVQTAFVGVLLVKIGCQGEFFVGRRSLGSVED